MDWELGAPVGAGVIAETGAVGAADRSAVLVSAVGSPGGGAAMRVIATCAAAAVGVDAVGDAAIAIFIRAARCFC
jgi:hypothetical protein